MTSPDPLAERVVATLRTRGLDLATSESLTGGLLGGAITGVPGASEVYLGGVVAYATAMKESLSGVPREVLDRHGAVSEQTVTEMALGIQALTGADWTIAVSGVAGPTSQEGHPPGEVWVGIAGPSVGGQQLLEGWRFQFEGDRARVREQTVAAALGLLLTVLSPV